MEYGYPKDFRSQFVVSENESVPDGAQSIATRSFQVALFPGLDAIPVKDSEGQAIGLILGNPITPGTQTMHSGQLRLTAPCPKTAPDVDTFIEENIYALAGPFIFLLDVQGFRRLYLDACGSLSAVYDPETRRVAATSLLLLEPESATKRFRAASYKRLGVIHEGWFVGGLTAHEGIFRLMPNFYLDLDSYEAQRHWPTAPILPSRDYAVTCAEIASECRNSIAATLSRGGVNMALTAGNETRLLLSVVKDMTEALHFFTVDTPNTQLDVHTATLLANRHDLNHRLLPEIAATSDEQADWHARTGHTFGGSHVRTHPTTRQFADQPYFVGGLGGEIGRGFFWRKDDTNDSKLEARDIWARTGMPSEDSSLSAVQAWLTGVMHFPALLQLDLAYLELRMGCWGFAMSYANHTPTHIHPLISRANFTAMLSLPPEWRRVENRSNRMIREIIRQGWPELLDVPINSYGDYRDQLRLLKRALSAPHRIPKKLRKIMG